MYMKENVEDIECIAKRIIKKNHHKLANINIEYRFRDKARTKKGEIVYYDLKKVPNLWQTFTDADVIVIIPKDIWDEYPGNKREAMLDEAFCNIGLIPIEGEWPKLLDGNLFKLSNGKKIQGEMEARRQEEELPGYKIELLDFDFKGNRANLKRYGDWKGLKL